jgi:hypothetical protein
MDILFNTFLDLRFLSGLIGALMAAFIGYFISSITSIKTTQRRSCKNDIKQGIENGLLQWDDLSILAQRWNQSRADMHWILSDLLHESLASKDEKERVIYQKVKELLKTEHNTEPFAELPESIRIHVETVSSRFRENGEEVLRPLATAICDTIVESNKKSEGQRRFTIWSLFIGILSLLIGIASLVFAIALMTPVKP